MVYLTLLRALVSSSSQTYKLESLRTVLTFVFLNQ